MAVEIVGLHNVEFQKGTTLALLEGVNPLRRRALTQDVEKSIKDLLNLKRFEDAIKIDIQHKIWNKYIGEALLVVVQYEDSSKNCTFFIAEYK